MSLYKTFILVSITVFGVSFSALAGDSVLNWSTPVTVNGLANSLSSSGDDGTPHIHTDGKGRWGVAWISSDSLFALGEVNLGGDFDILFAYSDDEGATWSAPTAVNSTAETDTTPTGTSIGRDSEPALAADGDGNWMCVWLVPTDEGSDTELVRSVSTDNGETWSDLLRINSDDITVFDGDPGVATDGRGNWIAYSVKGNFDTRTWRSSDLGATWLDEALVLSGGNKPTLSTDSAGTWLMGISQSPTGIAEAATHVSKDIGVTWSLPVIANPTDDSHIYEPVVATDQRGIWMLVVRKWIYSPQMSPDLYSMISKDNGVTWSPPTAIVPNDTVIDGVQAQDAWHDLATDGRGNWLVVWNRPVPESTRYDVYSAVSTNDGDSWSAPVRVNDITNEGIDPSSVGYPQIAADGMGAWLAVWSTRHPPDQVGTSSDYDIVVSKAAFTGSLNGVVTLATAGVSCGAVRITDSFGEVDRVAVTDVNGLYSFVGLPVGTYTAEVFAEGTQSTMESVSIGIGESKVQDFQLLALAGAARVTGTILGDTTPGNTAPIFGARVDAFLQDVLLETTFTCGRGLYSLVLDDISKGQFTSITLEISADGYTPQSLPVNLPATGSVDGSATLEKAINFPGTLTGIIKNNNGDAIAGARIEANGATTTASSSDNVGAYAFDALPSGVFTMRASATDYTAQSQTIAVPNDGSVVILNFDLEGGGDPSDIDGENGVNSIDIQLVINCVLGEPIALDCDVNNDSSVNSIDIQIVINTVLGIV